MGTYVVTVNGKDYEVDGVNSPQEAYAAVNGTVAPLDHDFQAGEMLRNIPGSALGVVEDLTYPVRHPLETAEGLGKLAGGTGQKLFREGKELFTGVEEDPYSMEAIPSAVGEHFKQRYGGIEELQRTLQEDPVGLLTDVAGIGSFAKNLPGIAGKAGAVVGAADPIRAAVNVPRHLAKVMVPKNSPANWYGSAAKFTTVKTPQQRRALIDTALKEGIMPTSKGAIKVSDRIDMLNNTLEDFIDIATEQGVTIPAKEIFSYLSDLRSTKGGVRKSAKSDLAAIDKAELDLREWLLDINKTRVTPSELQAFKQDLYKGIDYERIPGRGGTRIGEDIDKAMARASKDAIARRIPEASELNKRLGELIDLEKPVQRAAGRVENRDIIGLGTTTKMGGGTIGGYLADSPAAGAALGLGTSIIDHPKMKAAIAIAMDRIKNHDIDWLRQNSHLPEVRIALIQAGRTGQINEEIGQQ